MTDPFRHHPELRNLITPPERSYFRDFDPAALEQQLAGTGVEPNWRYPDDLRNALFREMLATLPDGDIWVFGYGSLIWDPAVNFAEVRHAYAPDYERRFILVDEVARGTPACHSVMAALDCGQGCNGLAFRLAAATREVELEIIWRRERIGPGYVHAMIPTETAAGPVTALAFLADHTADNIHPGLSHAAQVAALAKAQGVLGTNFDYIRNLKAHFDVLGIRDDSVERLYAEAAAIYPGTLA